MRYSASYVIKTPVHGVDWLKVLKEESMRANTLANCLGFLAEEYASAKKEYPFYKNMEIDWVIYDFEKSSFYTGSFKIEENKSFLELATEINLSQFKKF